MRLTCAHVWISIVEWHRRKKQRLAARLAGIAPLDLFAAMGLRAEAKGARFRCHVCVHVQVAVRLYGFFSVYLSATADVPEPRTHILDAILDIFCRTT